MREIFVGPKVRALHHAFEKNVWKMALWGFGLEGWKILEELGRLEAWDPWGKSANGCLIALPKHEDRFLQQQMRDQFVSG